MTDVSRINEAIDATSAVVAAFCSGVGIKAVYGVGSGKVVIPEGGIMAGVIVPGFSGDPIEPFTHVSDVPSAQVFNYYSADVTEIVWSVPFRVYLSAADQTSLRKAAMTLPPAYLTAFSQNVKLLGIVPGGSVLIKGAGTFNMEAHGFDGWGGIFQIVERLDLRNIAGA